MSHHLDAPPAQATLADGVPLKLAGMTGGVGLQGGDAGDRVAVRLEQGERAGAKRDVIRVLEEWECTGVEEYV